MTLQEVCRCIDTAYQWHGGGGSPLYGFASTRRVGSEDHRWGLIREIKACMASTDFITEHVKLEKLYEFVSTVALEHEVCERGDYVKYRNP